MIEELALALSNKCGARCVFCPSTMNRTGDMSIELVEKILKEISSPEFKSKHNLKMIRVSDNGDGFLNKNIIEILRMIKKAVPDVPCACNTTFHSINEEIGKIDEKLTLNYLFERSIK